MNQSRSPLANLLRFAICLTYFFGGILGLYVLLPATQGFMTSWLAITLFGFMLGQNIVAIYGSFTFFKNKPSGGRLLYWLSWTSVPVFSSELISYHSIIGLGLVPMMSFDPHNYGMYLLFEYGYNGVMSWFPTYDSYQLGINLVPLVFIGVIRQLINVNEA